MGHQDHLPGRIRFRYEKSPDARLNPTHGVWGGINSQGEIEACFYAESDVLPAFTEQLMAPDGSLSQEMIPDDDIRHITRHIHTRIVMNYRTARAVLEWLEERVNELENEGGAELLDFKTGIEQ